MDSSAKILSLFRDETAYKDTKIILHRSENKVIEKNLS
jgi:hypothetical protein